MPEHQDPFVTALEAEFAQLDLDLAGCGLEDEDDRTIAGYLRAIRHRRQEIEDVKAFAEARAAQLERQIASIETWRGPLIARIVHQKLEGKKAKSLRTPYGRAGFRHKAASISWENGDLAVILAWAKQHCPEAVQVILPEPRETLLKTPLVEAKLAGAVIPGTRFVEEGDQFYVDVKTKKTTNGDGGVPAADEEPVPVED